MNNYKVIHTFPNGEKRKTLEGCVLECNEDTEHIFKFLYDKALEISIKEKKLKDGNNMLKKD